MLIQYLGEMESLGTLQTFTTNTISLAACCFGIFGWGDMPYILRASKRTEYPVTSQAMRGSSADTSSTCTMRKEDSSTILTRGSPRTLGTFSLGRDKLTASLKGLFEQERKLK